MPNNLQQLNSSQEYVIIGRFGRTYGVQGWIKVRSFTDPPENILQYSEWYINLNHQWSQLELTEAKCHGVSILAKIEALDTPELAKRYTNFDIAIPRSQLPAIAEDEIYLCDLPGFTVKNQTGTILGTVDTIFDNGAHPILSIHGEHHYLIPFIREIFVKSIQIPTRHITVEWDSQFTT